MVGMLALHRQDTAHMQQDLELLHQLIAEMLRWLFNGLSISWWMWTPNCHLCNLPWSALITKCLQRRPKYMLTVDCCNGQAQFNEPALRCIFIVSLPTFSLPDVTKPLGTACQEWTVYFTRNKGKRLQEYKIKDPMGYIYETTKGVLSA